MAVLFPVRLHVPVPAVICIPGEIHNFEPGHPDVCWKCGKSRKDIERPERDAKCGVCGHTYESHDYNGCLCFIEADASQPCPCKVWKPVEAA